MRAAKEIAPDMLRRMDPEGAGPYRRGSGSSDLPDANEMAHQLAREWAQEDQAAGEKVLSHAEYFSLAMGAQAADRRGAGRTTVRTDVFVSRANPEDWLRGSEMEAIKRWGPNGYSRQQVTDQFQRYPERRTRGGGARPAVPQGHEWSGQERLTAD